EWQRIWPAGQQGHVVEKALQYSQYYRARRLQNKPHTLSDLYGLVYLAHAYCALDLETEAVEILQELTTDLAGTNFEPILFLETLSRNNRLGRGLDTAILEEACRGNFLKARQNPHTDSASWAEAVVALPELAPEVARWLSSHQTPAGYFTQSK